jgi:hypothetical protein
LSHFFLEDIEPLAEDGGVVRADCALISDALAEDPTRIGLTHFVLGHAEPLLEDRGVVCSYVAGCKVAICGSPGKMERKAVDGGGGFVGAGVIGLGEEAAMGELGIVVDEVVTSLDGTGGDAG